MFVQLFNELNILIKFCSFFNEQARTSFFEPELSGALLELMQSSYNQELEEYKLIFLAFSRLL